MSVLAGVQVALGVGLQVVLGYLFGTGRGMEEYLVAVSLPQYLQLGLGPALTMTIPPLYRQWEAEGVVEEATAAVLACVTLGGTMIAVVVALAAAPIAGALAPGIAERGDPALVVALVRVLAFTIVPLGVTSFLTAVAIARRRFRLWPVAAVVAVAAQLGVTWFASARLGIWAVAWGYIAGATLPVVMLAGFLPRPRNGLLRGWAQLGPVLRLAAPVSAARFASRATTVSDRWVASWLGLGAIAQVVYGSRMIQAATVVLTSGVGSTLLPRLSELADEKRTRELASAVVEAVRFMAFLVLPVAALLGLWAAPLVTVLLGRGAFTGEDVRQTAGFLAGSAGVLASSSLGIGIWMALHALRQHARASLVAAVSAAVNVGLAWALSRVLGVSGIALSFSLVATVNLLVFTVMLWRLVGEWALRPWRSWRDANLVALGLTSCLLLAGRPFLASCADRVGALAYLLVVVGGCCLAGALYLGTAWMLGSPELRGVVASVTGKHLLGRPDASLPEPPELDRP